MPDITRFSKQESGGVHIAFWSYFIIQSIVLIISAFSATAANIHEVLDLMLHLNLGVFAFVIVIASSWVLNSMNLYSSVLSVNATYPKMKQQYISLVLGIIGVISAFMNFLDYFIEFLSFLTAMFIPIAGIIIIDFFFVKRDKYKLSALANNNYFYPSTFTAWLCGMLVASFSEQYQLIIVTGIVVLDSIIVTGFVYFTIEKLLQKIP